jgi:hypothetical protein
MTNKTSVDSMTKAQLIEQLDDAEMVLAFLRLDVRAAISDLINNEFEASKQRLESAVKDASEYKIMTMVRRAK